jgi:hypothetical protein
MPDASDQNITMAQAAAALVLAYAPLLRKTLRLPAYPQPAITWRCAPSCNPAFAAFLRTTWARLDLRDQAQFSEGEALLFRYLRMHGLRKLYHLGLPAHARHAPEDWHAEQVSYLICHLGTILGEKLLALMTPADRAQWFPWHGYNIRQGRDLYTLTLHCDSMGVQPSSTGQPMYFSARRPTVLVQGVRRPVAFTAHAIQRMQERRIVVPNSHASLYDTFSFVNANQYFEPTTLYRTQPAVVLFDVCPPPSFCYRYVTELLGPSPPTQPYAYRLGYCPLVQEGDFSLAKTLLVPGFIGTPEYVALMQTSFAPGVKERMLAECEELSMRRLVETEDFGLLRWFHTHGIPQVIPQPAGMSLYEYD